MYDSETKTRASMTLLGHHKKNDANSSGNNSSSSTSASSSATNNHSKETDGQRHGSTESSGAESWRSTDTVRGGYGSMKVNTVTRKLG